ncbi:MAG: alpha-E domain-containing protein [Bryocella sp.]
MLSRVADSLYWMSRYLERAEHATRLLDVNLNLMLDEGETGSDQRWMRVLQALGKPRRMKSGGDPYELARSLTFNTENKSSVLSSIMRARENARHVREQISTEQWHRINSLYLDVTRSELRTPMQEQALDGSSETPTAFLHQVLEAVHQFQGVTDSTMSHGEGWQFIQVGRYLERTSATAMLLEAYKDVISTEIDGAAEGTEYLEWMGLLRSATAFEAYCKVYTADITPDHILEFLLLDPEFPHSMRFSVDAMVKALEAIQKVSGKSRADELRRVAGRLEASLAYASVDELLSGDWVAYLRNIQKQCQAVHEMIYHLYVDYSIQAALAG